MPVSNASRSPKSTAVMIPPSAQGSSGFRLEWLLPLAAAGMGMFFCLGCSRGSSTADSALTMEELAAGLAWEGRETQLQELPLGDFNVSRPLADGGMLLVKVKLIGLIDPDHATEVTTAITASENRLHESLRTLLTATAVRELRDPNLAELKLAAAGTARKTLRTRFIHRVVVSDWSLEEV